MLCSLHYNSQQRAVLGVIGSTRMEYERLLPILDYFAARMGQSMAGQGQ